MSPAKKYSEIFIKGFLIGFTDIIPGISGGTMALILGIYDRIIKTIASLNTKWLIYVLTLRLKKSAEVLDYNLLIPLVAGILSGVLFFTNVVPLPLFIKEFTLEVFSFFFGLILHTIYSISKDNFRRSIISFIFIAGGFSLGFSLLLFGQVTLPDSFIIIFVTGVLSATAMILPGISGALILILLGKYSTIFTAIGNLDFTILLPFICGLITAVLVTTKIIAVILKDYSIHCFNFINGILISSLIVLWPFQKRQTDKDSQINLESFHTPPDSIDTLIAVSLVTTGFLLISCLKRLASEKLQNGNQNY